MCDGKVARDADAEQHKRRVETGEHTQEGDHLAGQRAVGPGRSILDGGEDKGEADGGAQDIRRAQVQQEIVGRPVQALVFDQQDGDQEVTDHADSDDETQWGQFEERGERRDILQDGVVPCMAIVRHRWRRDHKDSGIASAKYHDLEVAGGGVRSIWRRVLKRFPGM